MLTDYHVHLRPDEDDSTAERYFTAGNVERYREAAEERGIEELGVAEHIHRFVQSLDVWQHPWYRHWARDDIDEYCEFLRGAGLKVGIEADFLPGREDRVQNLLDAREWDYVVGSVHFLRDEAVDVHGEPDWADVGHLARGGPGTGVERRTSRRSARGPARGCSTSWPTRTWSRCSPGRVPVPEGDLRRFYERAMDGIAESDVAVEVSTAGLRKPAGEIYPAPAFLEMCLDAGRPVALSSDAHVPEQLGLGVRAGAGAAGRVRRHGDRGVRWALAPDGRAGMTPLRDRLGLASPGRGPAARARVACAWRTPRVVSRATRMPTC